MKPLQRTDLTNACGSFHDSVREVCELCISRLGSWGPAAEGKPRMGLDSRITQQVVDLRASADLKASSLE